jgi:hypothetical protein
MKKVLIIIALIAGLILIGLIQRENARLNTEAIEQLPETATDTNVPRTRAELEAERNQ